MEKERHMWTIALGGRIAHLAGIWQKLEYMYNNPVRAELVTNPE